MRLVFASFICLLGALFPAVGASQDQPVVVELFTSQGCSYCPPADAYLNELAKQPNVIALAWHVDYWDYIGWKDSFANPAFTERQRAYAHAQKQRMIYTPQLIINGVENMMGKIYDEVSASIRKVTVQKAVMKLSSSRAGAAYTVTLSASHRHGTYDVQLVRVSPINIVKILGGENAGKTVTYVNVVTDLRSLGSWDGQGKVTFKTGDLVRGKYTILVQHQGHGKIVAAAWLK
ncbi:MAG: DUF1223 domain-containing protein [Planktomarina sp.]|jgi:hypothetical protein|nr:DUF1223 domain-containing protein [Planktomarina sp.]MDT2057829.1 DUF1223 domain-containing protein [Planktomarina sp.]MDT2073468.1 DUF1223 domain-containing protein [Planktomarina sp.]MDT2078883.1 DUF1223 domain-containing protein [Planktomarina sp.]